MHEFEYMEGMYKIINKETGAVAVDQPFDPRTGEPFASEEEARAYATGTSGALLISQE